MPTPTIPARLSALITIGFLPQDAAAIVRATAGVETIAPGGDLASDLLHAATYLRYGNLVSDQFKGLWEATAWP